MSSKASRIQKIDVGTPSPEYLSQCAQMEWEAVDVCFHGFLSIFSGRNYPVSSSTFTCFGHQWCLILYPGGATASLDGKIALYLFHFSNESITLQYELSIKAKSRKSTIGFAFHTERTFEPWAHDDSDCGSKNFAKRSDVISHLFEGSLIIEVRMRKCDATGSTLVPFIAENPLSKTILGKFNDEGSADVVFEVGGGGESTAENKKTKISPTTFYAHRFILEDCAPELFTPGKSGEGSTTIPIPDVKPDIFRHLLYYTYGGKVAEDDLKSNAKDIMNAADKYGVVGLKLEAEAILVASTTITIDNLTDLLHLAVDTNCALLKEAAMDFVVKNKAEVVKKKLFNNFSGDLVNDVLMADIMDDNVRVSTLRKRLHEKGLDIDGPREVLIARLEESS